MSEGDKSAARLLLERVSRAVEALPDGDERTIRKRADIARQPATQAFDLLLRAGFIERREVNAEWHYRSLKPYRADSFAPKAGYGSTYSTKQGGGGW